MKKSVVIGMLFIMAVSIPVRSLSFTDIKYMYMDYFETFGSTDRKEVLQEIDRALSTEKDPARIDRLHLWAALVHIKFNNSSSAALHMKKIKNYPAIPEDEKTMLMNLYKKKKAFITEHKIPLPFAVEKTVEYDDTDSAQKEQPESRTKDPAWQNQMVTGWKEPVPRGGVIRKIKITYNSLFSPGKVPESTIVLDYDRTGNLIKRVETRDSRLSSKFSYEYNDKQQIIRITQVIEKTAPATYTFAYASKTGLMNRWEASCYTPEQLGVYEKVIYYKNGIPKEKKRYFSTGVLAEHHFLNTAGRLEKIDYYNTWGKYLRKDLYTYDTAGNLLSFLSYDMTSYDETTRQVIYTPYEPGGYLWLEEQYKYNSRKILKSMEMTHKQRLDNTDRITRYGYTYKTDDQGNIIYEEKYNRNRKQVEEVSIYTYLYWE